MTDEIVKPLTAHEHQALERYEAAIDRGMQHFVEVGEALSAIQSSKLYRVEYGTFEDYVEKRWGWKRQRAYQLMSSAQVALNIADTVTVPNERIARALSKLEDAGAQRLALTTAIATAPDGKLTSEWVESSVEVVIDAMHTGGLVDNGQGNWAQMNAAITHEVWTSMQTKKAQIAAKHQKAIVTTVVDGDALRMLLSNGDLQKIAANKEYRVIVYELPQKESK